jgi:glycosyltransferase involved in cell wall biosynthesis
MTVLINLSSLLKKPTGVSTYSLNLIQELKNLDFEVTAPFLIDGFKAHLSPSNITAEYGLEGHLRRLIWIQRSLPQIYQNCNAKLLFSPIPEAPLGSDFPSIVTVHDLIPLRFARWLSPSAMYARLYIPAVLRQAKHIICDSAATAQDVMKFCGISAHKITSILLAHDAKHFRPLELPTSNYFLFLGRIAPYKNVQRLITAFAQLPDRLNYELRIVGPHDLRYTPTLQAQAIELGIFDQVKFLDYVSYEDLPKVISQAIALVFPSLWEGFGLPVLEAMACGTPVITSNLASLPEVAGDAALLIDPYNVAAIAKTMHEVAIDAQLRAQLRTAGLARAHQFSWAKTGTATAELLQQFL